MIEPQITRGVQLAAQVLREAGVDRTSLQALYLTGGSSRIPYVHRRLSELGSIATLDDPKTVVAKGAAGFVAGGRATVPPAEVDTEVLRPGRRPQPTPRPAGPSPSTNRGGAGRTRSLLVIAGAGLAAVAAATGVFVAVNHDTGAPAAAAAPAAADPHPAGQGAAAGRLPAASADSSYRSETTDEVTVLLPTTLFISSTACEKSSFSSEGALQVRCLLNPDSAVGKTIGMERHDYTSITAWRDDQYARSTFIRLRDATDGHTTVLSEDGTRLVDADDSSGSGVRYTVIDRSTGLIATFSMDSVEVGAAFLAEVGWDS